MAMVLAMVMEMAMVMAKAMVMVMEIVIVFRALTHRHSTQGCGGVHQTEVDCIEQEEYPSTAAMHRLRISGCIG